MSVSYIGVGATDAGFVTPGTTYSTAAAASLAGDLVVMSMATPASTMTPVSTGWNWVVAQNNVGHVYWKVTVSNSEAMTYKVTSGGTPAVVDFNFALRGTGLPQNSAILSPSGVTSWTFGSLTFSQPGIGVVITLGQQNAAANAPAGFTTIRSVANPSSVGQNINASYKSFAAGSSGGVTVTSAGLYTGVSVFMAFPQNAISPGTIMFVMT